MAFLPELLTQSTIQDQICGHLSFEDALNLQGCVSFSLHHSFTIRSIHQNIEIILPGINEVTIRLYQRLQTRVLFFVIHQLIKEQDRTCLELLLKPAFSSRTYDKLSRMSNILQAVRIGSSELTQLFLDQGIGINEHLFGTTPLITAIRKGNLPMMRFLIEKGADVNFCPDNSDYPPPLVYVAMEGCNNPIEVIDFLIEQGVDLPRYLGIAFIQASVCKQLIVLQHLYKISQERQIPVALDQALINCPIDHFVDVDELDVDDDNKEWNQQILEIVRFLIEKGANVNVVDQDHNSILISSCEYPFPELTKYLLEQGANIRRNALGKTAFHIAARKEHLDTLKVLIQSGKARNLINSTDLNGETAFTSTTNPEIQKLLSLSL